MRPIPPKMRQELEKEPRMRLCTLAPVQGLYGACEGRKGHPEWHHVWVYAGQQINEPWAILGACTYHHGMVKQDRAVKDAFESASIMLATAEDLAKYPRKNWEQEMKRLGIKKLWHAQEK